ncbi:hypothetical protein [Pseudomonas sp. JZ134]|jgi:hypothetical protein|uniref:hypothetical protein n=1 Tax=Pseudomonas sp. JZ134 TaxID=2806615 RepID=UPI003DA09C89
MTTETPDSFYGYTITPRPAEVGGGFQLLFYEDEGQPPIDGGIFDDHDTALATACVWLSRE